MTKNDIIRKLTSRKFWALIAEFVVALLIALRVESSEAERIGALIMLGIAPIAYMFAEAWADSNRDTYIFEGEDEAEEEYKPPEEKHIGFDE